MTQCFETNLLLVEFKHPLYSDPLIVVELLPEAGGNPQPSLKLLIAAIQGLVLF